MNPLHTLNTIPPAEMVSLRPVAELKLLRDLPAGNDAPHHRKRRGDFYADLPDRYQTGITIFESARHDRYRAGALAAALVLMLGIVGIHRVVSGPAAHPVLHKAVR